MKMSRFFGKLAVCLAVGCICPEMLSSQEYVNTPVTVSKDKVRVNGEVCYSHVVIERQTLFSISKAYGVSIDEIYRLNPDIKESGLKKNAIILIPVESSAATKESEAVASTPSDDAPKTIKKKDRQVTHIRKWFEDLNSIAEKYGVTPEAIMQANNLQSSKLNNRHKLIIPEKSETTAETEEEVAETVEVVKVVENAPDTSYTPAVIEPTLFFTPKDKITAAMMLPLKTADGKISRNNMDFYSGALLAVYDLAEQGLDIDFTMLDITDHANPVTQADIEKSDMVIGPVSGSDISRLLQSFPQSAKIISPLDPKVESLTAAHTNLIQAPTPAKMQYIDMVEWVKEDMAPEDTVLVITEKAFKQSDAAKLMMEVIDSSGIKYNPFSYNILEGRDVVDTLKVLMDKQGTSRVMIASESEAFVNDVVRNLNLMLYEQYNVILYAPSKIRSFDTIEVEHFHKTNMHVSLTYYIDYEDQRVKDFLLKYRALYNTEPSQFAFQGYDIAYYFINLCNRYGDRWIDMIDKAPQAMLQSTFRCRKADETGGYVNHGVRRIIYGDGWSIYELK